ncbi:MAG: hypothetical protein ABR579_11785, partial [Actinomycetota bacterium]
ERLAEQFGAGGNHAPTDVASATAVLLHAASWLWIVAVVVGALVNAIVGRPTIQQGASVEATGQRLEERQRSRASEAVLIKALELNDQHVKDLARLEQQIVYVPMLLLAGVVHDVLTTNFKASANVEPIAAWTVLASVTAFVAFGLWRNGTRHDDLLVEREQLRQDLGLRAEERRLRRELGRLVYFGLYAIGAVTAVLLVVTR